MAKTNKSNRKKQAAFKPWQVFLGLGGLLLVAAVLLAWANSAGVGLGSAGAPAVQVDKEKVDLGDVKLGEWVSAEFQITNTGSAPLTFEKEPWIEVVAGC